MSPLGQVHLVTALIALVSGAWVLLRRKGTARHRQVGWLYAASMLALNISALLIYRLTGTFGPFHFAALISLATLSPASSRRGDGSAGTATGCLVTTSI